jgi:D-serine deaminase-like pyridoxal phosphate-dependent protein
LVASGEAGPDRLPIPSLPEGLALLPREGAGEVQTPLTVAAGVELALGDPVFFRHAKAGELAEHVSEYLLLRGDRIEARAPTYRGLGRCFLG